MALLTVTGITKEEKGVFIVKDIYFTQQPHQKIAVAGETGSGKTTLLRMIAGWTQPTSGEIHFKNEKVTGPFEQLIPGHPGIAYLGQHFELRNHFWVHEILEYANELSPPQAHSLYRICRIDHLLNRRTDQLSGGERQRIALTRLLIMSPSLLLLDEPFSNLDILHKNIMRSVIRDIGERLNTSCIMVMHDPADILSWADMILVMKDGQLIQQGTPEQVYRQPVNEYCAGLFGEYNLVNYDSKMPGKRLLIRPEQIRINNTVSRRVSGTIQAIQFRGNYYMIEVEVDGEMIRVQNNHGDFVIGDKVFLSWPADIAWYV